MAGIYIHIPFCKQACNYCNFHFSTSTKNYAAMVSALLLEIALQRHYLQGATIQTIYIGGGTPSLLPVEDVMKLLDQIANHFSITATPEITLEANPDDLNNTYLSALRQTPVNRLSIGIQSFYDDDLRYMHRAHNATEAENCLMAAQDFGFENISVDLIYATPNMTQMQWEYNVQKVMQLKIPHISCYSLTVEPKTALHTLIKKKQLPPPEDEQAEVQFATLMNLAQIHGYEHYEVSNFCLPDRYAQHNTNYWRGVPYLGIGASAHSFNQVSRQWNVANNALYVKALEQGVVPFEMEALTIAQQYNEYVMLSLRTMWGCDASKITLFGEEMYQYFLINVEPLVAARKLVQHDTVYYIPPAYRFQSDGIASDLFWVE
ncbi:MAG: radical SAM family heme chaperone HemW [Saprospiraceae bacterium]|nr:radical SAM family heme chaperone HemW [Saprospiraceae bacterium]MBP7699502.1 radical SAM family heme chaperone HemW [Saprospiraceae bacterium]